MKNYRTAHAAMVDTHALRAGEFGGTFIAPATQCTADACKQGRLQCPCPAACALPESQPSARSWFWSDFAIAVIAVVACIVIGVSQ